MHSPFCFLNFLLEIPFEIRWNFFSGTFPDFFLEVFPAFNEPGIPGMKGKIPGFALHGDYTSDKGK
jgi:hypothetical protein